MEKLLEIKNLTVSYGEHLAVQNVSLEVEKGQIVMLAGESGSGKSTVLKSILGLLGENGTVQNGEILFCGRQLPFRDKAQMRLILGKDIAVILQDPERYLDPMMSIGAHYYEIMASHGRVSGKEAKKLAIESLSGLGFEDPESILSKRQFELSGGMCQRAAMAISMANHPVLLLGDEPTSALDVVLQQDVMDHLSNYRDTFQTTIFLVTHNMSLVSHYADMVGIMKGGIMVEWGTKDEMIGDARHPYTRMLLDSVPRLNGTLNEIAEPQPFEALTESGRCNLSDTHWYLESGGNT